MCMNWMVMAFVHRMRIYERNNLTTFNHILFNLWNFVFCTVGSIQYLTSLQPRISNHPSIELHYYSKNQVLFIDFQPTFQNGTRCSVIMLSSIHCSNIPNILRIQIYANPNFVHPVQPPFEIRYNIIIIASRTQCIIIDD